jgi:FdhE protein
VPGGLWSKIFGSPPDPYPELADALAELRQLAQHRPTLTAPVEMLREILPQLFANPPAEQAPAITHDSTAAKSAGGIPLLRGEAVALDVPSFRDRWFAVCQAMRKHQNPDGAQALISALEWEKLVPAEMLASVLAGRPEEIHARADILGLDAGLTTAVLGLTLFPVLNRFHAALAPLRDGLRWDQGYCPTCGSWPLLGEFRGLEQARFLRCGLCAAEWEFPRLLCPYCGEREHRQLGYFGVEGEESRYRAATCDACRGYVKMVSTLAPLSSPALLVANVATLHLDLAAADRGYASPA